MSLGYGMDRYLFNIPKNKISHVKIELKLERLRSEDTPCHLMITHTIDQFILLTSSYRIPSQNKVKAKTLEKLTKNWNLEFCYKLNTRHTL